MSNLSIVYTVIAVIALIISSILFIRRKLIRNGLKISGFYVCLVLGLLFIIFLSLFTSGWTENKKGVLLILFGIFSPLFLSLGIGQRGEFFGYPGRPFAGKRSSLTDGTKIKDLTAEFLKRKRMKLGEFEYKNWLRKEYTMLGEYALERKEVGLPIERAIIDGLRLFENELNEASAGEFGKIPFQKENISEKFSDYKNIK